MSRASWMVALALLMVLTFGALGALHAQTQVKIARPLDGATVRETVRIIVPASSVPAGGYVSLSIDGRRRSALAKETESDTFVYEWDTKALDPDANLPMSERQPREGSRKIAVQAYDAAAKKFGDPAEISVIVKNKAPELMPASGLLLRYARKIGATSRVRFFTETNLRDISGARELAATIGQSIEAIDFIVAQSVEDIRPDGTALIRQKLDSAVKIGSAGRMMPVSKENFKAKAAYRIEDGCGRTQGFIESRAQGEKLVVELPNLPVQRVRIGDQWADVDNVFQEWTSGSNMSMNCSSTLEGVEWEGGYPCAKIKTVFSGTKKLPNSTILTDAVPIKGERVTYFAFQVGKVISSETTVTLTADLERSAIDSLSDKIMSVYTTKFPSLTAQPDAGQGSETPDFGGGMPNEAPPGSRDGMFGSSGSSSFGGGNVGGGGDRAKVTFELKQLVELVH